MRISDCSSDVCSSDLPAVLLAGELPLFLGGLLSDIGYAASYQIQWTNFASWLIAGALVFSGFALLWALVDLIRARRRTGRVLIYRSEEHTSELQSLMRISYAVFCLKKKKNTKI